MILGVYPVSFANKYTATNSAVNNTPHKPSFKCSKEKLMHKIGIGIAVLALYASACCTGKNNDNTKPYNKEIANPENKINDSNAIKHSNVYYHYLPSDSETSAENYSWKEEIFSDGTIKRDSFGYEITIDPDKNRTSVYTSEDELGNKTIIEELPDGTKVEKIDYNLPNEVLNVKTVYWENGKPKESEYYNKYFVDSVENGQQKVDLVYYKYNIDGVLLYWTGDVRDTTRSADNNVYDKYGRILYDDLTNEKYFYKRKSKTPYKIVSEQEECQRIKIYDNGILNKIYFKAKDGTITDLDSIQKQ